MVIELKRFRLLAKGNMVVADVVAVCLLLCSCGGGKDVSPSQNEPGTAAQNPKSVARETVVVTSRQVKQGELFSGLNVETKVVDGNTAPPTAIESIEEIRGRAAKSDLASGTIVNQELVKEVLAPN
jgi:flagella basal body P-ring formation protein FlgA